MRIGFTASRELTKVQVSFLRSIIEDLGLEIMDEAKDIEDFILATEFITGGCWGGDTEIAKAVREYHPGIPHKIILPADRSQVDRVAIESAWPKNNIIEMPGGSTYRDRNERIVSECDRLIAFWTGNTRSGTHMTINIGCRAGKMMESDIHRL